MNEVTGEVVLPNNFLKTAQLLIKVFSKKIILLVKLSYAHRQTLKKYCSPWVK
jgi:hypothetical protein